MIDVFKKWMPLQGRFRRFLVGGLGVLLLLIIVAGATCSRRPGGDGSDGPFFEVARGPLTINVTESGTINPSAKEILKNEIEGRTTILYLIEEGTVVKKGDLLVELDVSDLQDAKVDQEIKVQNAEAAFVQSRENLAVVKNQAASDTDKAKLDLRFAKEDLVQYREGEYPNLLKEQEARITLAEEEQQRARERVKWSEVLFAEKYIAESELQADQLAARKAALDVDLARDSLALLKDFTYKRTITELESAVKQTEMALERSTRKASADIVQAESALRAKESEFKQQSDKLTKLKDQIAKARIVAPRDGLVVYATSTEFRWRGGNEPLEEGQEVREREELIHLPTASTFKAEVKVHESNLDKIRVGLPVRITVDVVPGKQFTGHVSVIAPLPDPRSMFMNPDLKLYDAEVSIDGGSDVLRTGMSCKVDIIVEHYKEALYVPVQAVTRIEGRPTVFVKQGANVEARPVEIGLDNNRMVRVISGIKESEKVLLAPPLDTEERNGSDREDAGAAELTPKVPSATPGPPAAARTKMPTRRPGGPNGGRRPSGGSRRGEG